MAKKRRKLSRGVYDHANKTKDKGGSSKQSYIDWNKLKKGDEKLKFFESTKGTHRVNIVPFLVKSKLNPLVKQGIIELGNDESDYMLDVFVHKKIGPNEADILCPKENYGKRCPVCEESQKYFTNGKIEEGKALKAKRRVIFNVQPLVRNEDDKLEAQSLQIFEVSHWLFAKALINEANACEDGEDVIYFADTEEGKIVKFRVELEKYKGNDVPKYVSFSFVDREEEIADEVLDEALSFDEALILLSVEEIEKIMFGQDEDDSEEEPEKKKDKKPDKDDDEASEEEETPKKKKKESDDDDDLDDDEKEEKEEEKSSKSDKKEVGKKECPAGHKWGDANKHKKDCKNCDEKKWDDCADAGDE